MSLIENNIAQQTRPVIINENEYFSAHQFAFLICRPYAYVIKLTKFGNGLRKLEHSFFRHISKSPFIPTSEYAKYVFPQIGRKEIGSEGIEHGYCFNTDGSLRRVAYNLTTGKVSDL